MSVDLLNLKQNFESQFEVTVMIECFLSAENQCSVNYAGNFNFDESGPNQIFGQWTLTIGGSVIVPMVFTS